MTRNAAKEGEMIRSKEREREREREKERGSRFNAMPGAEIFFSPTTRQRKMRGKMR
jgi:hypothetical protein